jgi:hypothetical protein
VDEDTPKTTEPLENTKLTQPPMTVRAANRLLAASISAQPVDSAREQV